ncbi:MAG TPA: hypothetical protein VNW52_06405 [Burkholderiaceae bacterium]|nr:hypothetical protein [Burkholderiaceae bacterium]
MLALLLSVLCLAACSPKYNWREVRGKDARFVVLLPDKPTTLTRDINLDGITVAMTMTAAEVDGVNFAVGYVDVADGTRAAAALNAMKTALIGNIHGSIKPATPGTAIELEALGHRNDSSDALLLLGHFETKGNRAYQVIVLGSEKAVIRDEAMTFFNSFKSN